MICTRFALLLLLLVFSVALAFSAQAASAKSRGITQHFLDALHGKLNFDCSDLSFCPHYSYIGIGKREKLGIEDLWLYYSRASPLLTSEFLTFEVGRGSDASTKTTTRIDLPLEIQEQGEHGFSGVIDFADMDIICYHAKVEPGVGATEVKATLQVPASKQKFKRLVTYDSKARLLTVETRYPKVDVRDPDADHPLTICVIAPEAFRLSDGLVSETNGEVRIVFSAKAANCASEQTFVIGIGEGETAAKIETRIRGYARTTSKDSRAASRRWLTKALDKFSFDGVPEDLRLHYAKAVYQTLSNTKAPRGRLRHFVNYPARGVYSAEFLWDACFTNVGVEQFNRKIAEGYLLNIVENQEPDGKMPQFVCATWNRPGESQAPIIGWSAWRLHEKFGNKKLISAIYGPLCRSIEWWFKNRDQDGNGVCEIIGGLECWDDSPRFDLGRVEGVDLNAYLYREMRILAKMATILGKEKEAGAWEQRAERHAAKALSVLFDEETGLYFDRLVEQNRLHKVFTPASFIPLWTGMPVPEKTARTMIRKYLLDPERFFGKYPFPVVAYNDPNCKPGAWWRGPVWPNIAWVMVEILDAYGYDKEAKEATDRLLAMMTAADELYELYHCKTGQPLGCTGYGWTSAVFMDLARRHKEAK